VSLKLAWVTKQDPALKKQEREREGKERGKERERETL
jgi:hypothetical protein